MATPKHTPVSAVKQQGWRSFRQALKATVQDMEHDFLLILLALSTTLPPLSHVHCALPQAARFDVLAMSLMLVNTITSPTLQDLSPTDSHNPFFYPMLNASHPLSHAISFHPAPPQQTCPYSSHSTFLALHLPSLIFPAVLHSQLQSPKMPILALTIGCKAAMVHKVVVCAWRGWEVNEDNI